MNLSDEELLYLVMCGSELAFVELYDLYYRIVRKTVNEIVYKESYLIDAEDIVSDVLGVFMKIIYSYRSDRNASLRTYIKKCIKHRICTSLKNQYRIAVSNKQMISLDEEIDEQHRIGDYILKVPKEQEPNNIMMIQESLDECEQYAHKYLTAKERMVYHYLQLGYSTKEIADIMQISRKSCYNTAYRVSKKISNFNMTLTR